MKKKIILITIIILLLAFASYVVYYKFSNDKNVEKKSFLAQEKSYNLVDLENDKYNVKTEELDKITYEKNIITETVKEHDFLIKKDDSNTWGKVYIGEDSKLYLESNNETKVISDGEFKTMHIPVNTNTKLEVYALTKNGELYLVTLYDLDINSLQVYKMELSQKVESFTTLTVKNSLGTEDIIVVLFEDGNMYNPIGEIRYTTKVTQVEYLYYVYEDGTIANYNGNIVKDDSNKAIKAKYFLRLYDDSKKLYNTPYLVIITEDNKLMFSAATEDSLYNSMYVLKSGIKSIDYKIVDEEYKEVNVTLVFENNKKITLNGYYTDYYGFK